MTSRMVIDEHRMNEWMNDMTWMRWVTWLWRWWVIASVGNLPNLPTTMHLLPLSVSLSISLSLCLSVCLYVRVWHSIIDRPTTIHLIDAEIRTLSFILPRSLTLSLRYGTHVLPCFVFSCGSVMTVGFEYNISPPFTARCTIVQSAVLRSHVVCLSAYRLKILETNCANN